MSQRVLQVNFNFSMSAAELEEIFMGAAQPVADSPGLAWKIFLIEADQKECAGICLFDDEATLQAYLDGPIIGGVKTSPAFSNLSIKKFDVMTGPSAVTRAPVGEGLRV